MESQRPVPQSRLGRLVQLGRLAGGIAGNVLSEGARQLSKGQRPALGDLLIAPDNAARLAERLSEMRGAAMKLGQLLSMESGELIPPELSQALARLREGAHAMPLGQVAQVLNAAWGEGWERRFRRFSFTPMAAASIGQVHHAELKDGTRLAVKIQYPGIRRSIDSDLDNVAALLRLVNLLPRAIDLAPLLREAKLQLHAEADYRQEAAHLQRFAVRLDGDPRFEVPALVEELTTPEVLATGFLDGQPIETVAELAAPVRDEVAAALLELALKEVFCWGLVQTDPNFANFRYQAARRRLQLFDFGATRTYPSERRATLRDLMRAALDGDDADLLRAAEAVGYLGDGDPPGYRTGVLALLRTVTEPARAPADYAFGRSDLARRMSDMVIGLRLREGFGRLPPPEVLLLHRKLGGLYLLLSRLRATLPVGRLLSGVLEDHHARPCRRMPGWTYPTSSTP